jgi:cobyrinic acid a,c-diamide synthase
MMLPRILIAGLRGSSGKTLITLGLLAAWARKGCRVAPFKKGPDYIDAAWLSLAANRPCRNLDLFLMPPQTIVRSVMRSTCPDDLAVIEGNRGLFDGSDAQGSCSTAELAKLLQVPVLLVVDCTKAIRTVAAMILGCQRLDPQVPLRGVILNQIAGRRHESVVREAIGQVCGVPVLGAIPRLSALLFPERHLGLLPPQEHDQVAEALGQAAGVVEQYLDLKALESLARQAPPLDPCGLGLNAEEDLQPEVVRIGVFRDTAFQFYYPENLEALVRAGACLVEISPLGDAELPDVDALYLGGGFPETLAPGLAENQLFLRSLRRSVEQGLPVYAECGGAVFLGETLLVHDKRYPMAAVLPVDFAFGARRQGHGYVVLETVAGNPFFSVGETLRGHEFHYTYLQPSAAKDSTFAFQVQRGFGMDGQRDGLCHRNVLASYTHVHALATRTWAPALVRAALRFKSSLAVASEPEPGRTQVCAQ